VSIVINSLRNGEMATNTSRTLKYFRDKGWKVGVVERWNPYSKKRKDLFGIIDIIAMDTKSIVGVQSCGQSFREHERKILGSLMGEEWLESGGRLILIGWRKLLKKRGGKLKVWTPRTREFYISDYNEDNNNWDYWKKQLK